MTITSKILLFSCLISLFASCEQKMEEISTKAGRTLRYHPDGADFVIKNGTLRFNRALYGTNTAFRVECGDLPEFALFAGRGMGGNFRLGLENGKVSKWLFDADHIEARYRAGKMLYTITDKMLGAGELKLQVFAQAEIEGLVLKAEFVNPPEGVSMISSYGGASGKRLSRNGDLNVDPETVFYLKAENCQTNSFILKDNLFKCQFGKGEKMPDAKWVKYENETIAYQYQMYGAFPEGSEIKIADATNASTPSALWRSDTIVAPIVVSKTMVEKMPLYYIMQTSPLNASVSSKMASAILDLAEIYRKSIANRIIVKTPDPFINPIGGVLGIAANAIWEYPTYLHGAIGWRMRLNGWRGPYTADPLGWHNRAKAHYSSYSESQILSPASGPIVPDSVNNYARQQEKIGTALFTEGYICRNPNGKIQAHHYDMNLVFIDGLLRHFYWTGEKDYIKEMWPVIERHLRWEKRNFDGDNDCLYDAYCCIWASDALEYNGGGVSHSSAYNYLANKLMSELADAIGEDSTPFLTEANNIRKAMNERLWISEKGWYAEFVDELGLKMRHESAALWTVYHTMDSRVPDPFQAYQMMRYVDKNIPHIKVEGEGLEDDGYYTMSTTNWMPYTWSINNVVMAETLHTALSYWQGGHYNEGFKLWKSTLLDAMYLGSSPGNFVQLSALDAARGECYRDFADEVGMTARSLVEGLFGITPNMLTGTINIQPGLPDVWPFATLETPDIHFDYRSEGHQETYNIEALISGVKTIAFKLPAKYGVVKSVTLNGVATTWRNVDDAIGRPQLAITCKGNKCELIIEWGDEPLVEMANSLIVARSEEMTVSLNGGKLLSVFDPQETLEQITQNETSFSGVVKGVTGDRTIFAKVSQNDLSWWVPVLFEIKPKLMIAKADSPKRKLGVNLSNSSSMAVRGQIFVNYKPVSDLQNVTIEAGAHHNLMIDENLMPGRNLVTFVTTNKESFSAELVNWDILLPETTILDAVDMTLVFNDKVTNIFENRYLTPRWEFPTLATPVQGVGNWCHTKIKPAIIDSGLRLAAAADSSVTTNEGIRFQTAVDFSQNNILFTSQWDNYPQSALVPLTGKASQLYLLMAGSTNPMQSRIVNGVVRVTYTDGSNNLLRLENPDTWWPIEQDYFVDGKAFYLKEQMPPRLSLQTGKFGRPLGNYKAIKGFTDHNGIPGGAATVFNLPLNPNKTLRSLQLVSKANEVVIGLMAITLVR